MPSPPTHIDTIVFSNAVKYDRMKELINFAFVGSNANNINVYLDMYPIIRSIYSDKYNVKVDDYIGLAPSIINLCAHYRLFFRVFYKVESTFYIVCGKNCPELNSRLIPGYNNVMATRLNGVVRSVMDDMIKTNFDIMNLLCPYLPDIHFIKTDYETSVVIGYLIQNQMDKAIPNLVISKDIYPLQLIPQYPNTYFIRPYKAEIGHDLSIILKPINSQEDALEFWKYYFSSKHLKTDTTMIHPINISPVNAMSGMFERSVKSRIRLSHVLNMITQIIGATPVECTLSSIYQSFPELESRVTLLEMENRYHALNVPYQVETLYKDSVEAKTMNLENKRDDAAIRMISSKYFENTPLNLNDL